MNITDKYESVQLLHKSVRNSVHRCMRFNDKRSVIVKFPSAQFPTPLELATLEREYEIGKSLTSEHVIRFHELILFENRLALVMEDFDAVSLDKLLDGKPCDTRLFLDIAIPLVDALAFLHEHNVVHKDIKPANILIHPRTKEVRLIDFGISSRISREKTDRQAPENLEGSLPYIAPEQTGRMNRAVDYRSDFYSLGCTFYQLLAGRPPFTAQDPMELIHSHIARTPPKPDDSVLSEIILRLLAKNAEERYQSSRGLRHDLERCLKEFEGTGNVRHFQIARNDVSELFQLPQKLYGREAHLSLLTEALENPGGKLAMIAGPSGIGKSALIQELLRTIAGKNGRFISGKCEQFRRDIPYSVFVDAFHDLIRQALAEGPQRIAQWGKKLRETLGKEGGALLDLLPALENLTGPLPEAPPLEGVEARIRLIRLLRLLVRAFSSREEPLVVFLDDLQWMGLADRPLIEGLLEEETLFLIGGYRENEVSEGHPLLKCLQTAGEKGLEVMNLTLSPLAENDIRNYLADTLLCDRSAVAKLGELVLKKTGGNPFFVGEFLKHLHHESAIRFDHDRGRWVWEEERIQDMDVTENVVALLVENLRELDETTRNTLHLAACIGNRFDLATLAMVCRKTPAATAQALEKILVEGLLLPADDNYKYAVHAGPLSREIPYRFPHDSVQRAAYLLLPEEERGKTHHNIAKLLRSEKSASIFIICDHYAASQALPETREERREVATMNLQAGRLAMQSAAFDKARSYFEHARKLLEDESWKEDHLEACLGLAKCLRALGNPESSVALLLEILEHVRHDFDKVRAYNLLIQVSLDMQNIGESIEYGFLSFRILGIELPREREAILEDLERKTALIRRHFEKNTPPPKPMKASGKITKGFLIDELYGSWIPTTRQYHIPQLSHLLTAYALLSSFEDGEGANTALAHAKFGSFLAADAKDYEGAFRHARFSLELAKKSGIPSNIGRCTAIAAGFAMFWKMPMSRCLPMVEEGHEASLQAGDITRYTSAPTFIIFVLFFLGKPLDSILERALQYVDAMKKIGHLGGTLIPRTQFLLGLAGRTREPTSLSDDNFHEGEFMREMEASKNKIALDSCHFFKMQLLYFHGEYARAYAENRHVAENLDVVRSTCLFPDMEYYRALVIAAFRTDCENPEEPEKELREIVREYKAWSRLCPENFRDKYFLIQAESARLRGRRLRAQTLYDAAMDLALRYGYTHNAALAAELAGKFHLRTGAKRNAKNYFRQARHYYEAWGAAAKVRDLDEKYPDIAHDEIPHENFESLTSSSSSSVTSRGLDYTSLFKASRSLSGEMHLADLLEKLMEILLENSGARHGYLTLEKDGQLRLEAEKSVERSLDDAEFPRSVMQVVARTHDPLVLNDPFQEGPFIGDPHIKRVRPRSVLCSPILNQGKLVGVLYLENELTAGVFTPERLELLDILSSQAAVSIENARLYSGLEERVRERTIQLEEAKNKAETALKEVQALKDQQDGDYFLTSLLLNPLGTNRGSTGKVKVDFFLSQKKKFRFKRWASEIGGDINIADRITLRGRRYAVFLNADAMGKSIQGAGGALVLGSVFNSILERTKAKQSQDAGAWLEQAFGDMQKIFESFEGSMLMSLVFGALDEETGELLHLNAEHPQAVLFRKGKATFLENQEILRKLGTSLTQNVPSVDRFRLEPGDVVIAGSDGRDDLMVTTAGGEARMNEDETLFLRCVEKAQGGLNGIVQALAEQGDLQDDLSLLRLQFGGGD